MKVFARLVDGYRKGRYQLSEAERGKCLEDYVLRMAEENQVQVDVRSLRAAIKRLLKWRKRKEREKAGALSVQAGL